MRIGINHTGFAVVLTQRWYFVWNRYAHVWTGCAGKRGHWMRYADGHVAWF
jgi:hypothetical protein